MSAEPNVLFILGLMQRTGTNMVWDLLDLHPDVSTAAPIYEDYLFAELDRLDDYVDATEKWWAPRWEIDTGEVERLRRELAGGLCRFVAGVPEERTAVVLAKTPSLAGAQRFLELAPDNARVAIITRAPYPTVRSAVRTFGWSTPKAVRRWRAGAEQCKNIVESMGASSDKHVVLSYEHLNENRPAAVEQLLTLVGLDTSLFPMDDASNLAVRGSSAMLASSAGVTWSVEAPAAEPAAAEATSRSDQALAAYVHANLGEVAASIGYTQNEPAALSPFAARATTAISDVRRLPQLARRVRRIGVRQMSSGRRSGLAKLGKKR